MAVLALVAGAYLPASWRARRVQRTAAWQTPAGRLGLVIGGAAGLAAVGMFGLLRKAPDTPFLSPGELDKKLRQDVPLYLYPVTAPLAALGAAFAALAARLGLRSARRRSVAGEDGTAPEPERPAPLGAPDPFGATDPPREGGGCSPSRGTGGMVRPVPSRASRSSPSGRTSWCGRCTTGCPR